MGTRCFGQLAKGKLPVATCHVHLDVFSAKDVPSGEDEDEVEAWVWKRWRKKADAGTVRVRGSVRGGEEWSTS